LSKWFHINVHWMVLYNLKVFCSDMKFKMAATAGLSLTLDPMEKMFQNVSSRRHMANLTLIRSATIFGRAPYKVSVFYADRKSKMATTAGHRHVQFGFNHICSFWEEGIWTFSHRVQC
jgi:hypothetical protein